MVALRLKTLPPSARKVSGQQDIRGPCTDLHVGPASPGLNHPTHSRPWDATWDLSRGDPTPHVPGKTPSETPRLSSSFDTRDHAPTPFPRQPREWGLLVRSRVSHESGTTRTGGVMGKEDP